MELDLEGGEVVDFRREETMKAQWEVRQYETEITLPAEVWLRILSIYSITIEELMSVSMCSKGMRGIVRGLDWLRLKSAFTWPGSLLAQCYAPTRLTIRLDTLDTRPKAIKAVSEKLKWFKTEWKETKVYRALYDDAILYDDDEADNDNRLQEEPSSNDAAYVMANSSLSDSELLLLRTMDQFPYLKMTGILDYVDIGDMGDSDLLLEQKMELEDEMKSFLLALDRIIVPLRLPSTLVCLELSYSEFPVELLPRTLISAKLPNCVFPHDLRPFPRSLTELVVDYVYSTYGCPPNLRVMRHLRLLGPECFALLPSGLTSLECGTIAQREILNNLSQNILDIALNCSKLTDDDVLCFPRRLVKLSLMDGVKLTSRCLSYLPRGLKTLFLPSMKIEDEGYLHLPRGLCKLIIDDTSRITPASYQAYTNLPIGVKLNKNRLPRRFYAAHAHWLMQQYPADWLEIVWNDFFDRYLPVSACADLPRSMHHLRVRGIGWNCDCLANLPPDLESLTLKELDALSPMSARMLPTSLRSLCLSTARPTPEMIAALPDSLTELELWAAFHISSDLPTLYLPTSLTSLVMKVSLTKEEHYQQMPRGLTSLELHHSHLPDFCAKHLPPSLTHLSMPSENRLTDDGVSFLPDHLSILELDQNTLITDLGIPRLPKGLKVLSLASNQRLTDACVRLLPRTLLHIGLRANSNFTYLSLPDWPSDAVCLDLNFKEASPKTPFGS